MLWKIREHCLVRLPHLLPRIIDCVDYGRPYEVVELHRLIDRWPLMPIENVLQVTRQGRAGLSGARPVAKALNLLRS